MKQHTVEITPAGSINRIFPLIDEMASVEWFPGVLVLSFESFLNENLFNTNVILKELPENFISEIAGKSISFFRAYPFDFVNLKPTPDTQFSEFWRITR